MLFSAKWEYNLPWCSFTEPLGATFSVKYINVYTSRSQLTSEKHYKTATSLLKLKKTNKNAFSTAIAQCTHLQTTVALCSWF